jgi:hypothetical protein
MRRENGRLLDERTVDGDLRTGTAAARPTRSVTVNVAESPLGLAEGTWAHQRAAV